MDREAAAVAPAADEARKERRFMSFPSRYRPLSLGLPPGPASAAPHGNAATDARRFAPDQVPAVVECPPCERAQTGEAGCLLSVMRGQLRFGNGIGYTAGTRSTGANIVSW